MAREIEGDGSAECEILAGVAAGREDAFVRLVDRYQTRIYNLALRLIGDPGEAADLAQEVFLRIYRAAPQFKGDSAPGTWIHRIVVNACLNHRTFWRRRQRERWVSFETPADPDGPSMAELLPAAGGGPDAEVERGELREQISQELRRLPPEYRSAVVLRDVEGLSYEEIAGLLAISSGTVKSRINRGRRLLQRALGPLLGRRPAGDEP